MADALQVIYSTIAELTFSDFGAHPQPLWYRSATVQMAHICIGNALALFCVPFRIVGLFFAVWAAKELLGDIPNAGGSLLVIADSCADLCFGALGYFTAKSKMKEIHNAKT
jgi:hypothetical protein